nr:hypothetical protein [Herbaspirillum sp. B39]
MPYAKNYATLEVLTKIIQSLTPTQQANILHFARSIPLSESYPDHRDLFHEAILRCLEGRRNWPLSIAFSTFILEVMKSISYADRENPRSQKQLFNIGDLSDEEFLGEQGIYAESAQACYEQKKKISEMIRRLEKLGKSCEDDPIAMHLIRGRAEGLRSNNLIQLHGMSFIEHDAARKRIERRIKQIP